MTLFNIINFRRSYFLLNHTKNLKSKRSIQIEINKNLSKFSKKKLSFISLNISILYHLTNSLIILLCIYILKIKFILVKLYV